MSLATPRILPSHLHAFYPHNSSSNNNNNTSLSTSTSTSSTNNPSTVRILGTLTSIHPTGTTATLESGGGSSNSNRESVTIILSRDSRCGIGGVYEVIGKVVEVNTPGGGGGGGGGAGNLGLKVLGCTEWKAPTGSGGGQAAAANIDMHLYEAVVDATHRYPDLFYREVGAAAAAGVGVGAGAGNQNQNQGMMGY